MDGGADEGHSFAWNDPETFIIWVPYGTNIKDDTSALTTIDASYCAGNLQGSDDYKILTVCDASNGTTVCPLSQQPLRAGTQTTKSGQAKHSPLPTSYAAASRPG